MFNPKYSAVLVHIMVDLSKFLFRFPIDIRYFRLKNLKLSTFLDFDYKKITNIEKSEALNPG